MNIEVKQTTSKNPFQMAKNIKKGFEQVGKDGKVAVYLPNRTNCNSAVDYDRIKGTG